jgi:hypothetical protein
MADNIELVQEDRLLFTDIADKLDISGGFAYSIIQKYLGYHKICARWMPKQLTHGHRHACSFAAGS